MSADQTVTLVVGLVVIAATAVIVAYATAHARRQAARHDPADGSRSPRDDEQARDARDALSPAAWTQAPTGRASTGRWPTGRAGNNQGGGRNGGQRRDSLLLSPTSVRQVARAVAFLFLAAAAVVVALTRAWPETEPAIFTLLALGTLLVVLSMDLVPPSVLGRWRRPAEALGAIVFLGVLTALTGGAASPFFVGFFLVVAGTALSTEGRAPLAIALLAAATLALVALVDALDGSLDPSAIAWVGFNAVALTLLADIATAAARAQRHARDEALRASRFDPLTGLYNRGFFFATMEQEIRRSERMDRGFTMLMLDLDDLKPVNDRFGHQWGDRLLRAVAETIMGTIRFTDVAARYGGDEFVILLPETDAAGGYVVGEKLRRDIAALTLHAADRVVRSSVSVGLVTYPEDGTTIEQLVAAADVAMYESKRRGKNRIVGYQTRTDRIATPIEVEPSPVPVPLTAVGEVRTGGDPAPWGSAPTSVANAEPPLPRPPAGPGSTVERRGTATRVPTTDEPGGTEPRAAMAPTSPATQPEISPGSTPETSPMSQADISARSTAPATPSDVSPGPAAPGTQPQSSVPPSPSPGADPLPGPVPPAADAPWLTRTDDSLIRPAASTGPKTGRSVTRRTVGRDPSGRSERVSRPNDRPWVVLPIEPEESEPPEEPGG